MRFLFTLAVIALATSTASSTFVTPASASEVGSSVVFGGSGFEMSLGVTDAAGNSYVTGATGSSDFPVTAQAAQSLLAAAAMPSWRRSMAMGTSSTRPTWAARGLMKDAVSLLTEPAAFTWLGETRSRFPTASGADAELDGPSDAFLVQLDPTVPSDSQRSSAGNGAGAGDRADP